MSDPQPTSPLQRAFADHGRRFEDFICVYAVISRRSRGLSIGVNLNVDQVCNFDCVYCMVNRVEARPCHALAFPAPPEERGPGERVVSLLRLREELTAMIGRVVDGSLWRQPPFADVEPSYRRLNDIAFSGDGEPTACPRFDEAVRLVIDVRQSFGLDDVAIVLITNATLLDRPKVRAALAMLDLAGRFEVWAKLDAGTQSYFEAVDRSAVPLDRVLANIADCGRARPIVIQTMLLKLHGQPMPAAEFDAYVARLADLRRAGCRIDRVQLYTIARRTAEPYATALETPLLQGYVEKLRERLPDLRVDMFPGLVRGESCAADSA